MRDQIKEKPMKTIRAWFLILLGILLIQEGADAQGSSAPATVAGVVTEAGTQRPLAAAQVLIPGTTFSAFTNGDGRYEIHGVPSGQVQVQVQLLGFTTTSQMVTVPSDGTVMVNFQLEQAVLTLDGLVVTALGIERERASLTYSVSEIGGAEFTESREINVANSLVGKVAGVNVTSMASGPGGSSRVVIRGSGSQRDSNQPLYVVNGMPITNVARAEADNVGGSTIDWGDGISSLNPDDIESITVLKGGPAAALYGSQAANGVILITTKKGASGRPTIEYNSNFTVGSISVYPNYQTEYGQGNRGRRPQSQAEAIQSGRLSFGERVDGQPSIQFDGQMRPYSAVGIKNNMSNFYRHSTNAVNTLSIAGGTESLVYRVSVSDLRAENILPNSGYKRKSANLSLRALITDRLRVESTLQVNRQDGKNRPGVGYVGFNANWGVYLLANTVDIRSLAPGYDPESFKEIAWQHVSEATNPYFVVNRMSNSDESDRYMMQSSVTFDLLPNLYLKGDVMGDFGNDEQEIFAPRGTNYRPLGIYNWSWRKVDNISSRLIAGYTPHRGEEFSLSAIFGGDIGRVTNKSGNLNGSEFVIPEWISHQNLAIKTSTKGISQVGTNSLFSSVDLGYRDMVFMSASGRQDWFSTLNPASNSIFYPSVGGSFILSRAVALPDVFNVVRLRASWAQVGASTVGRGQIYQTYGFQEGGHLGRPVQTTSNILNNPALRPLSNTTSEFGVDLELFDRRVAVDLTLYDRLTKDDIILTPIATSSGATSTLINAGEISNKGVELLLTGTPLRTPTLNWTISYNLAYNKNRVLSLGPGQTTGGTSLLGLDMSTFFRHKFLTTEDGTPIYNSRSNYELRTDVPVRAGVGVPPYTMGLTNTLAYKDWTLDVLTDGKFGHHFFSQGHQYMLRFGLDKKTLPGREGGLTVTGVDENGNPFTHHWPAELMDTYYNNMGTHNEMLSVQDASFIKLRSIVLRYDLPVRKVGVLRGLSGARISLVGRNVLTLYKNTEHFDPEQHYLPNDNAQSATGVMLPATREVGLNLRLVF
jgi:TonB-linked SusC/RagA family outer membrane protein